MSFMLYSKISMCFVIHKVKGYWCISCQSGAILIFGVHDQFKIHSHMYHRRGMVRRQKIHGFNPTEVFAEYFYVALARSAYYLKKMLIFMEKLCGALEHGKNHESLAQRIFPHLWYVYNQSYTIPSANWH